MAERQPLVLVGGVHKQIDPTDTIPASNLPAATPSVQGASKLGNGSLRDSLLAQTVADLGGAADQYSVIFDDFDQLVLLATKWGTSWGDWAVSDGIGPQPSTIQSTAAGTSIQLQMKLPGFGAWASLPFELAYRVSLTPNAGGYAYCNLGGSAILDTAGCGFVYSQSAVNFARWAGSGNPQAGTAANFTSLGTATAGYHVLRMRSKGDGTLQWRLDDGAWTAPLAYSPIGGSGGLATLTIPVGVGMNAVFDWVYFARKYR